MPKPELKIPVIVDTREQTPWAFNDTEFATIRGTLRTGDVSVLGLQDVIAVERKTLGDAVNTFIHGFTRWRRELYRLAAMDFPLIVIEASIEDIAAHKYESDAEPLAVLGRINGILIDHGVPVLMCGNREMAITMVERYLIQCVRKLGGVPT